MPVNPQVLQELIKKYGKKAVSAAVNAAKAKVMVPNMTGTATSAGTALRDIPKVESTVGKEAAVAAAALASPAIVADSEILGPALFDFGKDLASFEAIDNTPRIWGADRLSSTAADYAGRGVRAVLPDAIEEGPARAAEMITPFLVMAPEALAGRAMEQGIRSGARAISGEVEKKLAEYAAKKDWKAFKQYAKDNGLGVATDTETGNPVLMSWQGPMYLKNGKLEPVEGLDVAGSASKEYVYPDTYDPKAWENWLAGHGQFFSKAAGYPSSPATAFKYISDLDSDFLEGIAEQEGWAPQKYWYEKAMANAAHKADPALKYKQLVYNEEYPYLTTKEIEDAIDESVTLGADPEFTAGFIKKLNDNKLQDALNTLDFSMYPYLSKEEIETIVDNSLLSGEGVSGAIKNVDYWNNANFKANMPKKQFPDYSGITWQDYPYIAEDDFKQVLGNAQASGLSTSEVEKKLITMNSDAHAAQLKKSQGSFEESGPWSVEHPLLYEGYTGPAMNEGHVWTKPYFNVSQSKRQSLDEIKAAAREGRIAPLETTVTDVYGHPALVSEDWAANLLTDEGKRQAPNGLMYTWIGNPANELYPGKPGKYGYPYWSDVYLGNYPSKFTGEHDLAITYTGPGYNRASTIGYSTEGGAPNLLLAALPKQPLYDTGINLEGMHWNRLFDPTPENMSIWRQFRDEAVKKGGPWNVSGDLADRYNNMLARSPMSLRGVGRFTTVDQIGQFLEQRAPEFGYNGVLLRGLEDNAFGTGAHGELIWNPKHGGYPKAVHPANTLDLDWSIDNYLRKNGGKIHIKPENRGKFTALLKRTGKTASWYKAHGTPAQKKMAVFALNSRKWKHEDGGFLRNYFEDGGPEDGSVEKYISDRISEMRTAALENSRTRTDPAVPIVREYIDPKNTASLYNFCSQGYYSDADRNTTGLALYGKDGTVINTKVGVHQTKRAEEDYEKAIKKAKDFQDMANELYAASPYYIDVPGATCIYTATDNYGPSHRVSGNQTFAASPEKYGFVQIPMEDVQPGDIIQHVEYMGGSRVPVHGMIYDGQDSEGNMLFNYSDGGTGSSAIKVGSRYFPYDVDPNRHGNAFRFVGTPADSLKWKQEYMNLNVHSGGGKIRGKRSGKFYVTELNDRREKKFQDWYANAAATLGLDPNPDAYEQAYDYRGYWLNNRDADVSSPDFHFPDTWKQPHHPTFSDESIYAKGHEGVGHWEGETFVPGDFNMLMQATEPSSAAPVAPASYGSNYVPSDDILQYIKDTEAFRDQWYQDGNGVWTVGYGFTGDDVRKRYPNGMTRAEADQYFADTVSRRIPMFVKATPNFDRLNQNQRDALFSYYYNIGHGGYTDKSPNMQAGLRNMDLDTVVNNIDFGYNDKKNRGLRKRRDYERKLFGTPMDYGGILNRLRNVYGDNESVKAAILRAKNVKK